MDWLWPQDTATRFIAKMIATLVVMVLVCWAWTKLGAQFPPEGGFLFAFGVLLVGFFFHELILELDAMWAVLMAALLLAVFAICGHYLMPMLMASVYLMMGVAAFAVVLHWLRMLFTPHKKLVHG